MSNGVMRQAFLVKLKPNSIDAYVDWHRRIWAELVEEIIRQGIAKITLFQADPLVFLYSEVTDLEAWNRLWDSEIHRRWADEAMKPLMEYTPDGIVDAKELPEIWQFGSEPDDGGT